MTMNYLGIDIGTTATKAFLAKESGEIVYSKVSNELIYPHKG
jgi:sugar (pentulose or hexulose) kinase